VKLYCAEAANVRQLPMMGLVLLIGSCLWARAGIGCVGHGEVGWVGG
jgi:hypothetical protein